MTHSHDTLSGMGHCIAQCSQDMIPCNIRAFCKRARYSIKRTLLSSFTKCPNIAGYHVLTALEYGILSKEPSLLSFVVLATSQRRKSSGGNTPLPSEGGFIFKCNNILFSFSLHVCRLFVGVGWGRVRRVGYVGSVGLRCREYGCRNCGILYVSM